VDKVRVCLDRTGNTLGEWFAAPQAEYLSEEIGDDVIFVKEREGRVLGFEQLHYLSGKQQTQKAPISIEIWTL
jgi:hypothetical protein